MRKKDVSFYVSFLCLFFSLLAISLGDNAEECVSLPKGI